MADEQKILFSAEFEGEGLNEGVDETIGKMVELKEVQTQLKEEIKGYKKELNETNDSLKKHKEALDLAQKAAKPNVETIDKLNKNIVQLQANQKTLTGNIKQASAELVVASKGVQLYNKETNQMITNQRAVGEQVKKFTNVNQAAAQVIGGLRSQVLSLGTGLVAGLAGGIIAAAIPAIVEFTKEIVDLDDELIKLTKDQKDVNEVLSSAAKMAGDDIARLNVFKDRLNDLNIPAAERVKIAKEYNKTADETNKLDLQQINNLELINQKIEAQNKLILQRAISTAALNKLTEASTAFVDAELQVQEALKGTGVTEDDLLKNRFKANEQIKKNNEAQTKTLDNYTSSIKINIEANKQNVQQLSEADKKLSALGANEIIRINRLIDARAKAKFELDRLSGLLSPLITTEGLTTKDKPKADTKEIENVFEKMLADLKAKLAAITEKSFQSEQSISKKFEAALNKEFLAIEKLLQEKKLTGPQAEILKGLLQQINDLELSKSLEEFRKKREEAVKSINDAILTLQQQYAQRRLDNIRDDLQREREAIAQNFEATVENIRKAQTEALKKIDAETEKGLLDPAVARRKKLVLSLLYGGLITQAEQAKTNKELDLAFKVFTQTVEESNNQFEEFLTQQDEKTAQQIRDEKTKLMQGAINYETFQKNVTRILKEQKEARDKIRKAELLAELELINKQLASTSDKEQQSKLEDQQRRVRSAIAAIDSQVEKGDPEKKRGEGLIKYAQAVNQLLGTILSFWQQVNQAEAAALDRSIALQEKRLENARDVAEKGNAEYLEMEQKRMDELERKREENARKQLAINNALTLSQATVAAITAIAQATQSGSPFAALAALAAVVGAIAAAYQFVNSLKPQTATFFEGEEYVEQGPHPSGRDTIPAKLNIGERVVTTKDNKDYWETLTAIHNHKIPPGVINSFVESYPNINVPMVDYDKLSLATNGRIGADSYELLNKMDKLNNTMEEVVVGLTAIGFDVKLDEDGFSASLSRYLRREKLRKGA